MVKSEQSPALVRLGARRNAKGQETETEQQVRECTSMRGITEWEQTRCAARESTKRKLKVFSPQQCLHEQCGTSSIRSTVGARKEIVVSS